MVKSLPATQETHETWVGSLGQEDPLEEGMATHPSVLDWRILWTEEPGGLQSLGSKESNTPPTNTVVQCVREVLSRVSSSWMTRLRQHAQAHGWKRWRIFWKPAAHGERAQQ